MFTHYSQMVLLHTVRVRSTSSDVNLKRPQARPGQASGEGVLLSPTQPAAAHSGFQTCFGDSCGGFSLEAQVRGSALGPHSPATAAPLWGPSHTADVTHRLINNKQSAANSNSRSHRTFTLYLPFQATVCCSPVRETEAGRS